VTQPFFYRLRLLASFPPVTQPAASLLKRPSPKPRTTGSDPKLPSSDLKLPSLFLHTKQQLIEAPQKLIKGIRSYRLSLAAYRSSLSALHAADKPRLQIQHSEGCGTLKKLGTPLQDLER
jgi:hypothetical protein